MAFTTSRSVSGRAPSAPARGFPPRFLARHAHRIAVPVKAQALGSQAVATADPATRVCEVPELTPESWDDFLREAGDATVVVDFYAQWCGPCKLIAPELVRIADDIPSVRVGKFNVGTNPKSFTMSKGIKALPTFHIYQKGEHVGTFVGGKARELRRFVQSHVTGTA